MLVMLERKRFKSFYYTEKTTEHGFSLDEKNFLLTPIIKFGWHILTTEYIAAG